MECFQRVADRVVFTAERMKKTNLVDTPNLFCDVYAFEPGQAQTPHRHPVGDKLYYVLAGSGRIRVDAQQRTVGAGDLICAPAGSEHGVENPGPGRLTLLVVMAPTPSRP
jgi:quercetin dioxygenase-like cupin family protein